MAYGTFEMTLQLSPTSTVLKGSGSIKSAEVKTVAGRPQVSNIRVQSGELVFESIAIYSGPGSGDGTYWTITAPDNAGAVYAETVQANYYTEPAKQRTMSFIVGDDGSGIDTGIMNFSSGDAIGVHFYGFTSNQNAVNLKSGLVTVRITYYYDESQNMNPSTASLSKNTIIADGTDSITATFSGTDVYSCSHEFEWRIGSRSQKTTLAVGYTDCTFRVPTQWCDQITVGMSGTGSYTLYTYYGSKLLGTDKGNFTITVPTSGMNPTMPTSGGLTATINNTNTVIKNSWGNICVQGYSTITLNAASATGVYGASIRSYTFQGSGGFSVTSSGTSATVTTIPSGTAGLSGHYTVSYSVYATDSRGNKSNSVTVSVDVYPYSSPTVGSANAYQTDDRGTIKEDGTYITARAVFNYSPIAVQVNNETVNRNSASMKIQYKPESEPSWYDGQDPALSGQQYIFGTINPSELYTVRFTVTDTLGGTYSKEVALGTVGYCMFFKRNGTGVAIGMESTDQSVETFEVNPMWQMLWGTARIPGVICSDTEPSGDDARAGMIWLEPVS